MWFLGGREQGGGRTERAGGEGSGGGPDHMREAGEGYEYVHD